MAPNGSKSKRVSAATSGVSASQRIDARWLASFRRQLMAWFRKHARDLPWRRTRDPYDVWVSEIMLQQTQVATVVGYYERFLARWPTVAALAAADESDVLRAWEGLGYYRRARQLHAAARQIVSQHGGAFPTDFDAVLALPGIGRYTAGAILSISGDARLPILEANTLRLLARLLALAAPVAQSDSQRRLWEFAEQLLPRREVGLFNQALMELGSLVCTPREPRCDECPVAALCPTRALGAQECIPVPAVKVVAERCREVAVVVKRGARWLVQQAPERGRWAGLWDFPCVPIDASAHWPHGDEVTELVRERWQLDVTDCHAVETMNYTVTRFRIARHVYRAHASSAATKLKANSRLRWVSRAELAALPLNITARRMADRLLVARKKRPAH
ncbi:MAG: A/G-specific adenine glycosylase [Planctomycetes bacterium]|nr:A/G-specific adenine glycosylase [Planctomycetota bacterium]